MRKKLSLVLTLLFALLSGSVYAQLSSEKTYIISNNNDANMFMQDNSTGGVALAAKNNNSYWKFVPTENTDCYYIQNAVTGKYIQGYDASEQEVAIGDTGVEYYVKADASGNLTGKYRMSCTANSPYDFTNGTLGLNWKKTDVVQSFASVAGDNPRSAWIVTEEAMPEPEPSPAGLTSPYAGCELAVGTFFLYNVKTGKWMGDNHVNSNGSWTSHGELGPRGRDIDLIAGNAEGRFQLDPKLGNNHSINGSNLYMDTKDGVTNWIFTPVEVEGLTNCYALTTPDGKAMGANASNWATSDPAAIVENGNVWQLVSREQRLAAMQEGDDCSWLVLGGTFPIADSHREQDAYRTWFGEYGSNANGGDGFYHCNRVWELWGISNRDIYQDITVPNGKYKFKAQAIYVSTGNDGMNADRYNEYVADPTGNTKGVVYANDVTTPMINVYSLVTTNRVNDKNTKEITSGVWAYNGTNEYSTNIFEGKGWTDEVEVTVIDGKLRVGAKIEGASSAWMLIDNFTLTYAGELPAEDITPYIDALNKAIANAEAYSGKTTTTLQNALQQALTEAKAAVGSEDTDLLSAKTTALSSALAAAQAVDVKILSATIALAQADGVDVTDANNVLNAATTQNDVNNALTALRLARRVKNAETHADVFAGQAPAAGDFYLYNVGQQRFLCGGDDWGAHAAIGFPGILVTLEEVDGAYKINTHLTNGDDNGNKKEYLNYGGYCDTWTNDSWQFVEQGEGKYAIARSNDNNVLLGYSNNTYNRIDTDKSNATDANNLWKLISKADRDALIANASKDNPVDVSYLITSPNFSQREDVSKWVLEGGASIWGRGANHPDFAIEAYDKATTRISQTVEGLTPGTYELSVQAFYRDGNFNKQEEILAGGGDALQLATLFAGAKSALIQNVSGGADKAPGMGRSSKVGFMPDGIDDACLYFQSGLYWAKLTDIVVGEDGKMTIGAEKNEKRNDGDWLVLDNFRLRFLGSSVDLSGLLADLQAKIDEATSLNTDNITFLTEAIATATAALQATEAQTIVNATTELTEIINVYKGISNNIKAYKQTAALASTEGIATEKQDAAVNAITKANASEVVNGALNELRLARRMKAAETHENVFRGSKPAEGDFYLYNVAAKRFLCGGDDWGAHAAVGFPGQIITLTGTDGNYRLNTHLPNGGGSEYLGYNGYMDTNSSDTWNVLPVGETGAYVVARSGSNEDLLGYDKNTYNVVHSDRHDNTLPENQWILVSVAERDSLLELASDENPVDVSYKIQTPGFDQRAAIDKWTMNNFSIWGRGGNHPDFACESWDKETNKLSQTIEGLKSGNYKVSVQGYFRDGNLTNQVNLIAADNEPAQLVTFYAGDKTALMPNIVSDIDMAPGLGTSTAIGEVPDNCDQACSYFQLGLYKTEVEVTVGEDGKLEIGVYKNSKNFDQDWVVVDNFRLTYYGDPAKAAFEAAKKTLAEAIEAAKNQVLAGKTTESKSALATALTDAETALASAEATTESLTAAATTLNDAIKALTDIAYTGKATYAIQVGETHDAGSSVALNYTYNETETFQVAGLTFGFAGEAEYKAGVAHAAVEGFVAYTEGNGVNGKPNEGTNYIFTPKYNGLAEVAVVLNASKPFFITEDEQALPEFNGIRVTEKYYGTYKFEVKAGKTYKIYCTGSKLGFYGLNYSYMQAEVDNDIAAAELTAAKQALSDEIAAAKELAKTDKGATANQALSDAISTAETALNAADATVTTINAATDALKQAEATFNAAVTGIAQIKAAAKAGKVYDLQGRKVTTIVKGNTYIINGKKTAVK